MFNSMQAHLLIRLQEATRRPDRGLETLEVVAWAGGIIVVIGGLIALMQGSLQDFWNSIDFASVKP